MDSAVDGAIYLLSDMERFSRVVVGIPLRDYQLRAVGPVLESVLAGAGREYLLVFPRQSGKNEAVAQMLVYLLNMLQRLGGNIVYGASGTTLGLGKQRLEARLENPWNRGRWEARANPDRRSLGRAAVVFLSTHPSATSRGHTADWLLVVDEAQDQEAAQIEAVFTPMRAARRATALYIGTVKLTSDYLWRKKRELEAEQALDGRRRVFLVGPEEVTAQNPAYACFLAGQVQRYGRQHPIVASEYFLEPVDGSAGLFTPRRRALMRGSHPRRHSPSPWQGACPEPGRKEGGGEGAALYVATLDLAGEDEGATGALDRLENPGRDYTVATAFQVVQPGPEGAQRLPCYLAVDVFVDQGSRHFAEDDRRPEGAPVGRGGMALVARLAAWLEQWQVAHLVADETGVGLGVVSWLRAALGEQRVSGFRFSAASKAALGSRFVALIETGRFRYWSGDEDLPLSDGWWFWRQCEACGYDLPPEGTFDRDLRWGVPAGHRTSTPAGLVPTHDDRLLSAALIAELDRLAAEGALALGLAHSAVIAPRDPLRGTIY